ncbi:GSCOCG00005056001-RA-CDS [Cotesia congregata]|nr:GSCOCG00005056001-RA-CDS [Cotesia congregata]
MQQNLIWTALAGVWIILIVSQAKEQFYYDNRTIETAINYPITHDESVSPPYDLSSSSSIALTSSPTRNSITVKSYRVNITLKTRNQIFSDTSNSFVEKIAIQTTANPSDKLNVLSYAWVNKFKTIDSNPKTTPDEMTTIKTNFIEAPMDISSEVIASIKSSEQPHLIQSHENVLQVPVNKITHSESKLKSYKDKNEAENNNEFNSVDKHVTETSEMHSALFLSKNDEQNEDLSPETYTELQDPTVSANNTLKKFKEAENEHQKQKNRVLGNLFGKLVRDKPPTSSANEKSRSNYLEAFVTSKPFELMPSDATIWKVDKNSSIKSNHWESNSANYFPSTDMDNDAAYRPSVTDVPFTASEINDETKGSDTTEISINVDESVTSRFEINSPSLLSRIRENDPEEVMEGLRQ